MCGCRLPLSFASLCCLLLFLLHLLNGSERSITSPENILFKNLDFANSMKDNSSHHSILFRSHIEEWRISNEKSAEFLKTIATGKENSLGIEYASMSSSRIQSL